jgi:hypothetical protein
MTVSSSINQNLVGTSLPSRYPTKDDSFHNVFEDTREIREAESQKPTDSGKRLEFYKDFKQITRLTERIRVQQADMTPNIAYLAGVNQKKLRPNTFGLASGRGKESSIDIRMFSMGDNYAEAFSQGIKHINTLENLNLKSNRLSDVGSEKILKSLDVKQIKRINLSENRLGEMSVNKLTNMFSFYDCKLKHLNLEKTGVSTQMIQNLCTSLLYYRRLTKLVLAKNNLSDVSTRYLKDMLINNSTLKVLDLHWNNFSNYGGSNLFEGLSLNKGLKSLDISWNSIGRNKSTAEVISKCVKQNTALAHLDISYNSITAEDAEIIAEGLKSNHTILGIHVLGNACEVDPRGFLKPNSKLKIKSGQFYQRIIDRPNFVHEKTQTNCWVCEKWREVLFTCESEGDNVYLHLLLDDFEPEAMPKADGDRFELYRAVPPSKMTFFFTEINSCDIKYEYKQIDRLYEKTFVYQDGISSSVKVNRMGTLDADTDTFETCSVKTPFMTKPRSKIHRYLSMFGQMERVEWNFNMSIFREYKPDNDRVLDDCLEFDWRHSRIPNFVKNSDDLSLLRQVVRQHYPIIKLSYKNLSAYGGSDVFSIGSNIFTDFLNECKIIDSTYLLSDLGVNMNSTLIQKEKGQLYNPGNSLVRYEFLEIIIRVAADKYIRTKQCQSYHEAFTRLYNEHLSNVMSKFSSQKWRLQNYWVEEVDWVLKTHKTLLVALFNKYSGKNTLPGKKRFMSLEEFRMLCNDAGLVGEKFATREIDVCFCESMMTQVDELYSKRHLEMNFVEMLEALSRAVDLCDNFQDVERFSSNQLIFTSLSKKLELSFRTFIKLCPLGVQDDFEFPSSEVYSKLMYRVMN